MKENQSIPPPLPNKNPPTLLNEPNVKHQSARSSSIPPPRPPPRPHAVSASPRSVSFVAPTGRPPQPPSKSSTTTTTTTTSSTPPPLPESAPPSVERVRSIKGDEKKHSHSKRRRLIREEIISTENSYVASLKVLEGFYVSRIKEERDNAKNYGGSKTDFDAMICSLETLTKMHVDFLTELVETDPVKVAEVLNKFADHFKMYSVYLNGYEQMKESIAKVKKNKKGAKFLQEIEEDLKSAAGLSLNDYLIMPIQRVPRYRSLLEVLLKACSENHPQYQTISNAHKKVCKTAMYVNEAQKKMENRQRLTGLADRLTDIPKNFKLVLPARKLVREGPMIVTMYSGVHKKLSMRISHRRLFLFNDILVLTKDAGKNSLHWKGHIALSSAKVEEFEDDDNTPLWMHAPSGHRKSTSQSFSEMTRKYSLSNNKESQENLEQSGKVEESNDAHKPTLIERTRTKSSHRPTTATSNDFGISNAKTFVMLRCSNEALRKAWIKDIREVIHIAKKHRMAKRKRRMGSRGKSLRKGAPDVSTLIQQNLKKIELAKNPDSPSGSYSRLASSMKGTSSLPQLQASPSPGLSSRSLINFPASPMTPPARFSLSQYTDSPIGTPSRSLRSALANGINNDEVDFTTTTITITTTTDTTDTTTTTTTTTTSQYSTLIRQALATQTDNPEETFLEF